MQPAITPVPNMTIAQRNLVRNSIDLLRDYAGPFTLLFYGKLFELDPGARRLFHNDLAAQGRKLLDMLTSVAESLDDFEAIRPKLADLGRQHSEYGVRPEQYETLTTALLWSVAQALEADFDSATREAWRLVLEAISTAMRAGAQ